MNRPALVIDGSVYFDRLYRKYSKSNHLNDIATPVTRLLDYMFFTMHALEKLFQQHRSVTIYYNINHRIDVKRHPINHRRVKSMCSEILPFMSDSDVTDVYRTLALKYGINIESTRKRYFDYDGQLPKKQRFFMELLLKSQSFLTADDIHYGNLLVLHLCRRCKVFYTNSSCIDYRKHGRRSKVLRYIRRRDWYRFRQTDSIVKPIAPKKSIFEHFTSSRELPLIDSSPINNISYFIDNSPDSLYEKNTNNIILDEFDDLEDELSELSAFEVETIINTIIERWRIYYPDFEIISLRETG